jgi:hypothetical protein
LATAVCVFTKFVVVGRVFWCDVDIESRRSGEADAFLDVRRAFRFDQKRRSTDRVARAERTFAAAGYGATRQRFQKAVFCALGVAVVKSRSNRWHLSIDTTHPNGEVFASVFLQSNDFLRLLLQHLMNDAPDRVIQECLEFSASAPLVQFGG